MELLSDIPPLLSACGLPAYTNYVRGFQGCLDYIFIQPDCMQVLMAEDIGETHFCFTSFLMGMLVNYYLFILNNFLFNCLILSFC